MKAKTYLLLAGAVLALVSYYDVATAEHAPAPKPQAPRTGSLHQHPAGANEPDPGEHSGQHSGQHCAADKGPDKKPDTGCCGGGSDACSR